jgi:hypothetical protein
LLESNDHRIGQASAWEAVFDKVTAIFGTVGDSTAILDKFPGTGKDMILNAIQHLADNQTEAWISVEERMPNEDDGVELMFYSKMSGFPADTFIGVNINNNWHSCGIQVMNVTHWKHKPKAPQ